MGRKRGNAAALRKVAESVDITEIIQRYTKGKIIGRTFTCPFHDDAHPSAHIRVGNRWCCYVCNEGGDTIDFVSKLFGLSIMDAARRINDDFELNIPLRTLSDDEKQKIDEDLLKKQEAKRNKDAACMELVLRHRAMVYAIRHFAPKSIDDMDHLDPRYVDAVKNIDRVAWLLDHPAS